MDEPWMNKTLPREVAERQRRGESRSIARLRSSLSTAHHPSFVQLYYALEARRTSSTASMVVQFVSPSRGAGVSTVASGYARVAAAGRPAPVLFVDASCRPSKNDFAGSNTCTLIEAFEDGGGFGEAIVPAKNTDNLLWARLSSHPDDLLGLGGDRLQDLVKSIGHQAPTDHIRQRVDRAARSGGSFPLLRRHPACSRGGGDFASADGCRLQEDQAVRWIAGRCRAQP